MKILEATEGDIEDILLLNSQLIEPFEKNGLAIPFSDYFNADWVLRGINGGNQFVLKDYSKVVGAMCMHLSMQNMPENEAYIESLAVGRIIKRKALGRF